MQITLYRLSYPVKDSPVGFSLIPYPEHQKHTFTVGGKVFEAKRGEVQLIVPDDSTIDPLRNVLSWTGTAGKTKSTATEVFNFAQSCVSGFKPAKS